jgi:hypothetical protein
MSTLLPAKRERKISKNAAQFWYEQIKKDVPGVICDPEPK